MSGVREDLLISEAIGTMSQGLYECLSQLLTLSLALLSSQTANRTKELAANTLEELERQGDKLEAIDRDLHAVSSFHPVSQTQSVCRGQGYPRSTFRLLTNPQGLLLVGSLCCC